MAFDVAEIKRNGWQQGDVFEIGSSRALLGANYRGDAARLILW